jgi:hypothetical protein
MLIIRRLNCIDAASDIVLPVIGRMVHGLSKNSRVLAQPVHLTGRTIPDAASIQLNLLMMSI